MLGISRLTLLVRMLENSMRPRPVENFVASFLESSGDGVSLHDPQGPAHTTRPAALAAVAARTCADQTPTAVSRRRPPGTATTAPRRHSLQVPTTVNQVERSRRRSSPDALGPAARSAARCRCLRVPGGGPRRGA